MVEHQELEGAKREELLRSGLGDSAWRWLGSTHYCHFDNRSRKKGSTPARALASARQLMLRCGRCPAGNVEVSSPGVELTIRIGELFAESSLAAGLREQQLSLEDVSARSYDSLRRRIL
jgi:hypothetical protein